MIEGGSRDGDQYVRVVEDWLRLFRFARNPILDSLASRTIQRVYGWTFTGIVVGGDVPFSLSEEFPYCYMPASSFVPTATMPKYGVVVMRPWDERPDGVSPLVRNARAEDYVIDARGTRVRGDLCVIAAGRRLFMVVNSEGMAGAVMLLVDRKSESENDGASADGYSTVRRQDVRIPNPSALHHIARVGARHGLSAEDVVRAVSESSGIVDLACNEYEYGGGKVRISQSGGIWWLEVDGGHRSLKDGDLLFVDRQGSVSGFEMWNGRGCLVGSFGGACIVMADDKLIRIAAPQACDGR